MISRDQRGGGLIGSLGGADKVALTDVTFKNGTATHGGAVQLNVGTDLEAKGVVFENNTARIDGGAIYTFGSQIDIGHSDNRPSSIVNNQAQEQGGIVFDVSGESIIHFHDTELLDNSAPQGPAVWPDPGDLITAKLTEPAFLDAESYDTFEWDVADGTTGITGYHLSLGTYSDRTAYYSWAFNDPDRDTWSATPGYPGDGSIDQVYATITTIYDDRVSIDYVGLYSGPNLELEGYDNPPDLNAYTASVESGEVSYSGFYVKTKLDDPVLKVDRVDLEGFSEEAEITAVCIDTDYDGSLGCVAYPFEVDAAGFSFVRQVPQIARIWIRTTETPETVTLISAP